MVPGDLVEITGRIKLPCDMVLISGSLDVDESEVTGDTVLDTKIAINVNSSEDSIKHMIEHENTLIGGSKVVKINPSRAQYSNKVIAVVARTGFNSSKGKIIRSVLFSKTSIHPYSEDSYKVASIFILMGIFGILYLSVIAYIEEVFWSSIIYNLAGLVAFFVPPSIPACYIFR